MTRLLAWWRASLSGESPDCQEDDPQCGWYRYQAAKGGPWVPVRIYVVRDIDPDTGELTGPEVIAAEAFAEPIDPIKIWTWVRPISKAEYDRLLKWRMSNQHAYECVKPIDLSLKPTLPRTKGVQHA